MEKKLYMVHSVFMDDSDGYDYYGDGYHVLDFKPTALDVAHWLLDPDGGGYDSCEVIDPNEENYDPDSVCGFWLTSNGGKYTFKMFVFIRKLRIETKDNWAL